MLRHPTETSKLHIFSVRKFISILFFRFTRFLNDGKKEKEIKLNWVLFYEGLRAICLQDVHPSKEA
jgi:hypothetical protein